MPIKIDPVNREDFLKVWQISSQIWRIQANQASLEGLSGSTSKPVEHSKISQMLIEIAVTLNGTCLVPPTYRLNGANALIVAEYRDPKAAPVPLIWLTQTGIEFELHLAKDIDPENWDNTLIEEDDWNQLSLKAILEDHIPSVLHSSITLFI